MRDVKDPDEPKQAKFLTGRLNIISKTVILLKVVTMKVNINFVNEMQYQSRFIRTDKVK